MSRIALVVAASLIGFASAAEARLASQRITGTNRVCIYEIRRLPGLERAVETKVGLGERCPFRYRRPQAPRERDIPGTARLETVRRAGGSTVCIYVEFGRRYSHRLPSNATCPPTAAALD